MNKTKILFISTDVKQCTGYGKISHKILNFLSKDEKYDIYHFALCDFEHRRLTNRQLDQRIKVINVLEEEKKINSNETYGFDLIVNYMEIIKPDVLFIYNDITIITKFLLAIDIYRKQNNYFKIGVYMDLVYDYERHDFIKNINDNVDIIFVFTQYWKDNLIKMDVSENKIKIFNHGIDTENIKKMDKLEARKITKLNPQDFIFFNTNRNSNRKGWGITISAFIKLLKMFNENPRIKLFINCELENNEGYKIVDLIKIECIKSGVDFNKVLTTNFLIFENKCGALDDYTINCLYNATDVGLNTCIGEGFGLCNMEHASLGIPQIVSNVGGLKEVFKNGHAKLVNPDCEFYVSSSVDMHGGFVKICNPEEFTKQMKFYILNENAKNEDGKFLEYDINYRFNWDTILQEFKKDWDNFAITKKKEEKEEGITIDLLKVFEDKR